MTDTDAENIVGTAIYKLKIDTSDVPKELGNAKSIIANTMSSASSSTNTLTSGMAQLALGVNNFKQAFSGLSTGMDILGGLTDSYNRYQASMNGVTAVAQATGNSVSESMQVVKDATANGLISQSDAAAAVKNLEVYGYTAEQAAQMINVMADAAVYNRQANYSVSEAVRVTTEGIRMENSVLSDAAGINKNIAKMQEEYAQSLGVSTNELSQAQKAQAVYNGVLQEGGLFEGNAEEYTNTLAGAQDKLGTALETTKANLGSLFDEFAPIINGIADWINNNQQLIVWISTLVGVIGGAYGLIQVVTLAKKAIDTISKSLAVVSAIAGGATGNILKIITVLGSLGVATYAAAQVGELTSSETGLEEQSNATNKSLQNQSRVADDTAKKLAKLNTQISKLTRDYERDLKEIAVKHEENLADLNKQIEEANIDYRRAIDERNAEFNVSLAKQERSHQETVDELMEQINFLQRYNNDYNKQKLAQVEFALAKEERLYQEETAKQQAEIDLQNQADKEKLDARLSNLQAELDEELAFMNKHRETLKGVQHTILLDEVESLQERYNEQKRSYEEQIAEAGKAGQGIANTLTDNVTKTINERSGEFSNLGSSLGNVLGDSFIGKVIKKTDEALGFVFNFWTARTKAGMDAKTEEAKVNTWVEQEFKRKYGDQWKEKARAAGYDVGYASGGFTGRGNPTEVAGVVHKGEFVVPANQVDQSTGLPKASTGGNTYNITVTGGVWANSAQARREFAALIKQAAEQTNQARLQRQGVSI